MTSLADRAIASLRAHHDTLAAFVDASTDDRLDAPSGASQWSVADVLSHLGSGAEIMLVPIRAAVEATAAPEGGIQAVWDRWNAMSPREQAVEYVAHDARYVELIEGLDAAQRANLQIDLGFLPEPVPLEVALGMRLDEVALHAWDVAVAADPAAPLREESAEVLLDLMGGPMSFLLGFLGKADQVVEPVALAVGERGLTIGEGLSIGPAPASPTATWTGPDEAFVRLVGGRLGAPHTPESVRVEGNLGLDDLRRVFPGF